MKKFKIETKETAEQDLFDISDYIALDSEERSDFFVMQLWDKIYSLSEFPNMGISKDNIKNGLKVLYHGKYGIYYFIENNTISILRVLHGAKEVKELF